MSILRVIVCDDCGARREPQRHLGKARQDAHNESGWVTYLTRDYCARCADIRIGVTGGVR